ncbi:unnamed protein product, partial [Amoebophrya sp. A120]|eukprot:GSA120T00002963001.1
MARRTWSCARLTVWAPGAWPPRRRCGISARGTGRWSPGTTRKPGSRRTVAPPARRRMARRRTSFVGGTAWVPGTL